MKGSSWSGRRPRQSAARARGGAASADSLSLRSSASAATGGPAGILAVSCKQHLLEMTAAILVISH